MRVIAEAGQTMAGSIDRAVEMVGEFARAGAWGFKVQALDPAKIVTESAPVYWRNNPAGYRSQREAFASAGTIAHDAWWPVIEECGRHGIEFIATPFDLDAVDELVRDGVGWFKIASGDITFLPLLERVGKTRASVILSTGASNTAEVMTAYRVLAEAGARLIVPLVCTLDYPTAIFDANLARIANVEAACRGARRQAQESTARVPEWEGVGFSDHTLGTVLAPAAGALGYTYLEKHVTLDPGDGAIADNLMGLTPSLFREYVAGAGRGETLRGIPNLAPVPAEAASRASARRSARWARDLPAGHAVHLGDLTFLRPDHDPTRDGGRRSIEVASFALTGNAALSVSVRAGDPVLIEDFHPPDGRS